MLIKWGESLGIHKSLGGRSSEFVIAQYKYQLVRLTAVVGTFQSQGEFVRLEGILVVHLSPSVRSRIK